ncbi:MAG TPA: hypothetical protein VFG07_04390 [Thermoplasmata archaeon]|nr:hypothetical protein [Thermoplasmata archaeon]
MTPRSVTAFSSPSGSLNLGIQAVPSAICANQGLNCSAGGPESQVTLTATAAGAGVTAWPAVQVAFVLETTPFDGVFQPGTSDSSQWDPCAGFGSQWLLNLSPPCGESNGVPAFVANAGAIAESIQAAHPHSNVTFGLVDFGATYDNWDDSSGAVHNNWAWAGGCPPLPCNSWTSTWDTWPSYEYHVDVGNFVGAAQFQRAVSQTFQANILNGGYYTPGSNLSDNFLHSSSITSLYGVLSGQGIEWSNSTHHVIVLIGSTAPRDPKYVQNYCATDSLWEQEIEVLVPTTSCTNDTFFQSPACEPSYNFSTTRSPMCEGWVSSQDGNPEDAIAALAQNGPDCAKSLGGNCTIDTIDLYAMPTDSNSRSWWSFSTCQPGNPSNCSAAGTWWAKSDVDRVISAGCDLANATGGTWDGPIVDTCGANRYGTLGFVSPKHYNNPNTSNPSLLNALTNVGLGSPPTGLVLKGIRSIPMFQFVPWGSFRVDPRAPVTVTCAAVGPVPANCDTAPTVRTLGSGVQSLSWNWSVDPNLNALYVGDVWTASFYVNANGPPYSVPYPVDACVTVGCLAAGSGAIGRSYTSASAVQLDGTPLVDSFPYANVTVLLPQGQPPPNTGPPPPPSTGTGPPVLNPTPLPVVVPQPGVAPPAAIVSLISLQAIAAGVLAAGFSRVAIRPRTVRMAMSVPLSTQKVVSKFEKDRQNAVEAGRFE